MKYLNAYTFLASLVLIPNFSHAQIVLNEIMYDLVGTDTGKEWVEVYNSGPSNVDLSAYKFTEATTNHSLKPVNGIPILGPGEFAILADDSTKFLLDWPNYSGNLFDSTFSLNNTEATLTLKDSTGGVVDQISYTSLQGANGDGNTLQKRVNSSWISALPTPGMVNSDIGIVGTTSPSVPTQSTTTPPQAHASFGSVVTATISTHYSYIPMSDFIPSDKYAISAGRDRLAVAGSPIQFKAEANTSDKNAIYIWNFGDGSITEGKIVDHVYEYAGDYAVVLNGLLETSKAISRAKVRVVNPKLQISEANPQYISIKNNSKEEVNMFGFEMVVSGNTFIFPQDTIILSGATSIFSSHVTNVTPQTASEVVLKNKITSITSLVANQTPSQDSNSETKTIIDSIKKPVEKVIHSPVQAKKPSSTSTNTEINVANSFLAFKPDTALTEEVSKEKQGWFITLKHFLFGGSE